MLTLFALAAFGIAPPAPLPARQQPAPALHCHIEVAAGAKSQDCKVKLPQGKRLRSCTAADRQSGHCDAAGDNKYVAWVVSTGPGKCKISKKHTKWDKVVVAKLGKSPDAPSTCDLYADVQ